ncbi:hypothetical protein QJS10_CPB15g01730 [Acorus calamus]|uniref:Pre-mRNA-processing factor 17 n=1 Tax=Acorus calamus TaxID=4465 RepID=A0AAV9D7V2_ACOCL|nr:hypothetical protein QJS10_CPB15g01730 [Acorus calamus]
MDLLQTYREEGDQEESNSDDEEEHEIRKLPTKTLAPKVDDTALALTVASDPATAALHRPIDPKQHIISYNPTYDQLWAPIYGPAHPYSRDGVAQGLRNHKLGFVEDDSTDPFVFHEQYNTFLRFGYAADPSSSSTTIIGDVKSFEANRGLSVYNVPSSAQKRLKRERKQMEEGEGKEEEDVDIASDEWVTKNPKSPWYKPKGADGPLPDQAELTEEQKKYAEEHAVKKAGKEGRRDADKAAEHHVDKSTFHGKEERDYQGRSWIAPPKDAKPANEHCYIPKRLIHTWSGHTKGVSAIRFFPRHGHLLLSAGMDSKVKIWDVFESRKCMRTYMGHSKAVRDISFSNDGTKFLSASYDKNIKLWDTETGQVISTFSTGKIPYVVKLNPDEDKQNILLAGMNDKNIVQWDMNSGQITQEYDQHLGPVNTITFVDNNRRFVTSSDDKSLRVWEFGIPVVIKYISEPHMHSMPSISLHPNSNWLAAQSLDNQILIYGTKERFQLNKKKRFAGHIAAGYACQVNFSPDGRFVMSGDGEGKCWFWDWKSCKVFRTLKCHDGVCIGCVWHPLEQSRVATCGWDGLIKYWYVYLFILGL